MTTVTSIESLTLLCSIKGDALNKGRARTWLERKDLGQYGFVRHAPITVDFGTDAIVVRLDPLGKRKVAGRPDKAILDLCEPVADRDARFKGATRLGVYVAYGVIVIKA